jgi:hypothetical protein
MHNPKSKILGCDKEEPIVYGLRLEADEHMQKNDNLSITLLMLNAWQCLATHLPPDIFDILDALAALNSSF